MMSYNTRTSVIADDILDLLMYDRTKTVDDIFDDIREQMNRVVNGD